MAADRALFLWINGWAGRVWPLDLVMKALANDYFLITTLSLCLLWVWFARPGKEPAQRAVLAGLISLGLVSAAVKLMNLAFYRPRPFSELTVNLLFYHPLDSGFPSNATAIAFALATALFLADRRLGLVALPLAFLLGLSRVFVGVHYPLDVLGGAALGVLVTWGSLRLLFLLGPLTSFVLRLGRRLYLA